MMRSIGYISVIVYLLAALSYSMCFASWINIFGHESNIDRASRSSSSGDDTAPALSNFAKRKKNTVANSADQRNSTMNMEKESDGKTEKVVPKLLDVPVNNGNGSMFLNINLEKMMADPYVHGIVLPAAVGMIVALLTLLLVCSIRSCIRSQVRKRRKRRIRNLAEELKSDQKVLLVADSDDEI